MGDWCFLDQISDALDELVCDEDVDFALILVCFVSIDCDVSKLAIKLQRSVNFFRR